MASLESIQQLLYDCEGIIAEMRKTQESFRATLDELHSTLAKLRQEDEAIPEWYDYPAHDTDWVCVYHNETHVCAGRYKSWDDADDAYGDHPKYTIISRLDN